MTVRVGRENVVNQEITATAKDQAANIHVTVAKEVAQEISAWQSKLEQKNALLKQLAGLLQDAQQKQIVLTGQVSESTQSATASAQRAASLQEQLQALQTEMAARTKAHEV
jgi:hypothetical protein